MTIQWKIDRKGRAWSSEEFNERWPLTPEKMEASGGMIFWEEEDRLHMFAMLLENVGADRAVRVGDPAVWKAAVADLA